MERIIFPLSINMDGLKIKILHTCLLIQNYELDEEEVNQSYFGASTQLAVTDLQEKLGIEITGIVDEVTADKMNKLLDKNRLTVKGIVWDRLGQGIPGSLVKLYNKLLREEIFLAENYTDQKGFYAINHFFKESVHKPLQLFVKVYDRAGQEKMRSDIVFDAQGEVWINVMEGGKQYKGTSEFEKLMQKVMPFLNGLSMENLTEDEQHKDITFLSRVTELQPTQIMHLIAAHLLAKRTNLEPAIFYAFFRQNLPVGLSMLDKVAKNFKHSEKIMDSLLSSILSLSQELQKNTIHRAIENNYISLRYEEQIDGIIKRFKQLNVETSLDKPFMNGKTPIQSLLQLAIPDETFQKRFMELYLEKNGHIGKVFAALKQLHPEFEPQMVKDLKLTLSIAPLTKEHLPVVTYLKDQLQNGQVASLKEFARLDEQDWFNILQKLNTGEVRAYPDNIDGNTEEEKIRTYSAILESRFERRYPTTAFAARFANQQSFSLSHKEEIIHFFDKAENFNLKKMNIDRFVHENGDRLFASIGKKEEIVQGVKKMQRVMRLAPNVSASIALLKEDLHSSKQIYFMGKDRFVDEFATGPISKRMAKLIYNKAAKTYAAILNKFTIFNEAFNFGTPSVIPSMLLSEKEKKAIEPFEGLKTLFGSLDYCSCEHCNSVYSPAAYLVDLLNFLDKRKVKNGRTAKQILFDRRADIGTILLNCENTNIEIPYIDLVCELLENAISPSGIVYQTFGTSEELHASPANVNINAYFKLKDEVYPFILPFHLWNEEARLYLNHFGIKRYKLMEIFQYGQGITSHPQDVEIAAEFLEISPTELKIIYNQDLVNQPKLWGTSDPVNDLETVSIFLDKSGLSYLELLDLLNCSFINTDVPKSELKDKNLCDTNMQKITNLSLDRLDRIHRFIRLWRKTDWKISELDQFITSPAIGHGFINDKLLEQIKLFKELQDKLELSVEQLLSFYDPISIVERTNNGESEKSLYERLFVNKTISNPPDAAFDINKVTDPNTVETIVAHKQTILAALMLQEKELDLLLPYTKQPSDTTNPYEENAKLTLEKLSILYRYSLLIKASNMSVEDFILLQKLMNSSNPFAGLSETTDFLLNYEQIQHSNLDLQLINYVVSDNSELNQDVIKQRIEQLRSELERSKEENYKQTIIDHVRRVYNIEAEQAEYLLDTIRLQTSGNPLLFHLKEDKKLLEKNSKGGYQNEISRNNFPYIYDVYNLLYKISLVMKKLQITTMELKWLTENAAMLNLLEFGKIPITAGSIPFSAWNNLLQLYAFKEAYPERNGLSIFNILNNESQGGSTLVNIQEAIAKLTLWEVDSMKFMESKFSISAPKDYSIEKLNRLDKCFSLMKRIGVHADTLYDWTNFDLDEKQAKAIKMAVKAHYQDNEWLVVSSKLQDQIRDRKREALVQYLVHSPFVVNGEVKWHDVEGLFDYFLIDVEMSSCQATTRILQAVSAVQLFTQRILMNLEKPQGTIDENDSAWNQWKWMKNYRVWEANRKVFLYPENWIEPQLRDDKSPLFKELENELLQNDLTDDYVESAFLNYLIKLDDISRLQVCGLYHQVDSSTLTPTDILHVVAKTKALPPIYFYRQYITIGGSGTWTSWEKVDVDIQTENLVPVVYNRKLHLFWIELTEKPEPNQEIPEAKEGVNVPTPRKYMEIQLAWSVYKNGKWTPKVRSEKNLFWMYVVPHSFFSLKVTEGPDNELYLNIFKNDFNPYNSYSEHLSQFIFNGNVIGRRDLYGNTDYLKDLGPEIDALVNPLEPLQLPPEQHYEFNYLVHNRDNSNSFYALIESNKRLDNGLLLVNASKPYSISVPHQDLQFDSTDPFFYQDNNRVYFIVPSRLYPDGSYRFSETPPLYDYQPNYKVRYTFYPFSHSLTPLFIRELNKYGLNGLLKREIQLHPENFPPYNKFKFYDTYQPTSIVRYNVDEENRNVEFVDFSEFGAYSVYNWELFFHAPLFIACKLSQDQKFEEAMKWFHYIFDPTIVSEDTSRSKYWITKPFYKTSDQKYIEQQIQELMNLVAKHDVNANHAIDYWRDNPFKPHLIARTRTVAYQKAVVMKYLDNILAWADNLFRQDTFESINQATHLYILASVILGPKPRQIPGQKRDAKAFNDIQTSDWDNFSNTIENTVNPSEINNVSEIDTPDLPNLEPLYFCIPANDKLLSYWDQVADRLFKIRHCQNIEGITRELRLFEPPIDPGKLVEAVAAGMDIADAINSIDNKDGPCYRFQVVVQKAAELCSELKSLGSSLLSALEKRDAEELALLRSSHELSLLEKVKDLKSLQIDESQFALETLIKTQETTEARRDYYKNIVKVSEGEKQYKDKLSEALDWQQAAQVANIGSALAHLIPDVDVGVSGMGGTPVAKFKFGGSQLGASAQAVAGGFSFMGNIASYHANLASIESTHERRWEEWKQQELLANKELLQIEQQIEAAKVRKSIADLELKNHIQQMEQAKAVDEYMRGKYTNQDLYDWMVNQISTVYMQNYQLAFDIAKKAEKAFRYELGVEDSSFIGSGYWDSLKKGLLAGEKLYYDIKRMESAYHDRNRREYELTKPISLAQLDPVALMTLKETGECFVKLPETLFDMDYPGHYFRRIKSLGITIPAVAGPNTSISCTVTLLDDSYRKTADPGTKYERNTDTNGNPSDDSRFVDKPGISFGITQSIATSNALNDHGLFELNFRDERYLPFEGAGVISSWRLQLNKDFKQFDYQTISDVILHLNYTSRDGGEALKNKAIESFDQKLNQIALTKNKKGLYRLFSARHEFPSEWHRFLHPASLNEDQILRLPLVKEKFPLFTKNYDIKITKIQFAVNFSRNDQYELNLSIPTGTTTMPLQKNPKDDVYGNLQHTIEKEFKPQEGDIGDVIVKVRKEGVSNFSSLSEDEIEDIFMILNYKLIPKT